MRCVVVVVALHGKAFAITSFTPVYYTCVYTHSITNVHTYVRTYTHSTNETHSLFAKTNSDNIRRCCASSTTTATPTTTPTSTHYLKSNTMEYARRAQRRVNDDGCPPAEASGRTRTNKTHDETRAFHIVDKVSYVCECERNTNGPKFRILGVVLDVGA